VLSLVVALAACGDAGGSSPSRSAEPRDICEGTVPGGQVVLYSVLGLEYWYADVLSEFQLDCDVAVFYAGLPADQILPRLQSERSAPLADLVVADAPEMTTLADQGLLAGTGVATAAAVPADRCDARRRWCTVVDNFVSWGCNPALVQPPLPRLNELTAQRFHGKLLTSRPDESVDGLAMLAQLWKLDGDAAAIQYLANLEHNVDAHYANTDTMGRLVAAGADLAYNGDLHEELNDVDQYHNIRVWFPSAAAGRAVTLSIPFAAALVRGGQNQSNSRALLTYMWSKKGQSLVGLAYGAPARPDVAPGDSRSSSLRRLLEGVQILRIDWEQFSRVQPGLVTRWLAVRTAPEGTAPPSAIPTPPLPTLPPSSPPTPT
jgi:2-aminoethylphosphonate transport system substrate-binding protein